MLRTQISIKLQKFYSEKAAATEVTDNIHTPMKQNLTFSDKLQRNLEISFHVSLKHI